MRAGLPTYLSLVIRTAWRHSFHAAHSAILALIIAAGLVTYFVPQVEVLVDLHGWQVATFVLSSIVVIRLLLAPYWIWIDDQNRLALLNDQLADKARETQRLAEKTAAIDEIANEISWAVNNLVNPQPHPASTSEPEVAIAAFRSRFDAWCDRVSKKLGNRDLFTQGDQAHFDSLGVIPFKQMWGHAKLDWIFSELALKLDRLREVEHRARERK
jgi:superfamily I DNA/RNA helicase